MLTDGPVVLFLSILFCFFVAIAFISVMQQIINKEFDKEISSCGVLCAIFAYVIYYGLSVQTVNAVVFIKGG